MPNFPKVYVKDYVVAEKNAMFTLPVVIKGSIPDGYFGVIIRNNGYPHLVILEDSILSNIPSVNTEEDSYFVFHLLCYNKDKENVRLFVPNECVAQVLLIPYFTFEAVEVDSFVKSERGEKGFGSSGVVGSSKVL